ncbi:Fibrocystin-L [Entophlyctis luteolus]|nr:Fibrocystin-L [Entophlyctis luteolus]
MPVHMFGLQDYFQPTAVGTVSHSTGLLAKSLLNTFPLDEGGNPNGQMNFDENLCRYQISFGGSPANATVPIYANSYTPYRITINNGLTVFGCSSLNNCTCSPFANTTDCMQTIGCPHLASGLTPWNSTAAWSTQIVPTGTEASITVAPNQNVLIQNISFASSTVFGQIVIPESSSLIFADEPITFKTRGITVYGRLQAGAPTCRLLNYVSIVLYGKKTDQPLPTDPSVKGIYVTGNGQLDLHSQVFAPTWTRLATHAVPGATYIIVQDLVNWDVNQTIVITTTALKDSRDYSENDIVSIAWIEAAPHLGSNVCIIGLNSPLRFFHYGGTEYQAEVGLLSRRLGVRGSPDSDLTTTQASCKDAASFSSYPCGAPTGFGGHILINGTGVGRVTSAELAYMGKFWLLCT